MQLGILVTDMVVAVATVEEGQWQDHLERVIADIRHLVYAVYLIFMEMVDIILYKVLKVVLEVVCF